MFPDLLTLIDVLKTQKTVCLLAPSFPVDFKFPEIIIQLRKIGFEKIVELTFAAKLINSEYHKIFQANPDKKFICANCPTIVKLIQFKYPELKENIINVSSPMTIMSRFVKKEYGADYKTIFVGPCLAKKLEAKENGIDYAITFKELQDIFNYYEENKLPYKDNFNYPMTTAGDPDFDKSYNDYTKIYPLAGAVAKTMNLKGIMRMDQILIVDGPKNLDEGIQKFKNDPNIKFLDMLSCDGGCVGGPGIINKEPLENRIQKVIDYKKYCKKDKIGSKLGKFKYSNGLDLTRN